MSLTETDKIIKELEKYWEVPDGLFYELRYEKIFSPEKSDSFINLVESIEISGEQIDRRIVSLLWFLPLFLTWQIERFAETNENISDLQNFTDKLTGILLKKLGVP